MSYNNYLDCDAAYGTACDYAEPTCVVVKHTNPCGIASRPDLREAYRLAVRADPISAFGGIVAFNRCVAALLAPALESTIMCGDVSACTGSLRAHGWSFDDVCTVTSSRLLCLSTCCLEGMIHAAATREVDALLHVCIGSPRPLMAVTCRPIDKDLAEEIRQFRSPTDNTTRMFYEIVVAPGFTPDGLEHLKGKSKTLRILEAQPRAPSGRQLRQISGVCCWSPSLHLRTAVVAIQGSAENWSRLCTSDSYNWSACLRLNARRACTAEASFGGVKYRSESLAGTGLDVLSACACQQATIRGSIR